MGKRGPKKTPTNILKLRGSERAKDRQKNEPIPKQGMPKPPDWLDGEGLKEWFKWAQLLYDQGTLTLIDANVLAYYCEAHADFLYAKELCRTRGGKTAMVIKTTNGNMMTSPAYAIKRHAMALATKLAAELGMSPTGRTEINVPKPKTKEQTKAQKWVEKNKA